MLKNKSLKQCSGFVQVHSSKACRRTLHLQGGACPHARVSPGHWCLDESAKDVVARLFGRKLATAVAGTPFSFPLFLRLVAILAHMVLQKPVHQRSLKKLRLADKMRSVAVADFLRATFQNPMRLLTLFPSSLVTRECVPIHSRCEVGDFIG